MQFEKAVEKRGYHKKPRLFHFDNSANFREQILSYNHDIMRTGYCMRYCTRCGVGIRLMFYDVYYFRYHDGPCLCERCDEPVARITRGTGFRIAPQDGIIMLDSATIVGRMG